MDDEDTYRVVGFEVSPRSINIAAIPELDGKECVGDIATADQQKITPDTKEIKFSYDVNWEV